MKSVQEQKKLTGIATGIAVAPISMLIISHQPDPHPLITLPNLINFIIGLVSGMFCGVVIAKVLKWKSRLKTSQSLVTAAAISSSLGVSLFLLLTEFVKQLQQ